MYRLGIGLPCKSSKMRSCSRVILENYLDSTLKPNIFIKALLVGKHVKI